MKTEPHTKPPSHEGNPSQRSAPTFSTPSVPSVHSVVNNSAFSLVELLVVIAIIGMMVGLSALAVSGMRAPAVQHAADQVMSGLSLARQVAITKNTQTALLIATNTSSGFPSEPYRYWSVVYSNRSSTDWKFAKDWEALPNGAFFLDTRGQGGGPYAPIGGNPLSDDYSVGAFQPTIFATATFTINGTAISGATIPCIQFKSDGTKASEGGQAIRIAQGAVTGGNATLTSMNQYFVVETDTQTGRIRMRAPDSYRNP
jgi:prepilin-type N-terminal cleavage/methylation domain-containing protein